MTAERDGQRPRPDRISITDKRRIDPDTGKVREHLPDPVEVTGESQSTPPEGGTPADAATSAGAESDRVTELTEDLQRVQAEYANYRRRVERDRRAATETAVAAVLTDLLEVLDDVDLARAHGDLDGPFAVLAGKLTDTLTRAGLVAFGEVGDRFDPALHEAVHHEGEGADPIVDTVLRRGYRLGDRRVLRTALVTVADRPPEGSSSGEHPDSGTEADRGDQTPPVDG
ncbi:nucleotide exchange factor GrpE [Prescottella agglutinans]|uniref:nucleotide exchange factor GrpE n=1 Tax=Prescottella agglutinans TaxID=1644129 RepID=UPI003D977DD4